MIIVTTATLSLLLVGLLAVSMTPDPAADPVTVASSASASASSAVALAQPRRPLVTPIGDEGWGLTTAGAAAGKWSGRLAARLPNGEEVDVEIVGRDDESGLTIVSLPEPTDGYQLAADQPEPSDAVRVGAEPPRVVPMVAVRDLDVEEAAPVIDGDGDLVGLCTTDRHGDVEVRTVSTMPGQAPATSTTIRPATTVTSTPGVTPTTLPPATTVAATPTTLPTTSTTVPSRSTTVPPTSAPVTTGPVLNAGDGATNEPG